LDVGLGLSPVSTTRVDVHSGAFLTPMNLGRVDGCQKMHPTVNSVSGNRSLVSFCVFVRYLVFVCLSVPVQSIGCKDPSPK